LFLCFRYINICFVAQTHHNKTLVAWSGHRPTISSWNSVCVLSYVLILSQLRPPSSEWRDFVTKFCRHLLLTFRLYVQSKDLFMRRLNTKKKHGNKFLNQKKKKKKAHI
jgi:hypothetical protein